MQPSPLTSKLDLAAVTLHNEACKIIFKFHSTTAYLSVVIHCLASLIGAVIRVAKGLFVIPCSWTLLIRSGSFYFPYICCILKSLSFTIVLLVALMVGAGSPPWGSSSLQELTYTMYYCLPQPWWVSASCLWAQRPMASFLLSMTSQSRNPPSILLQAWCTLIRHPLIHAKH